MRITPVLFDCRPAYMPRRDDASLLLTPFGDSILLSVLSRHVHRATTAPLTIVAPPGVDIEMYRTSVIATRARVSAVCESDALDDALAGCDLSDALLLLESHFLALDGTEVSTLIDHFRAERRAAHHLVAFDRAVRETRERVSFDDAGQIRGIHRHYDRATWPFIAGVSVTVLPFASWTFGDAPRALSLTRLRQTLASRDVPNRDWPISGGAADLSHERGFLAASEHLVESLATTQSKTRTGQPLLVGSGQSIDPTARIVGSTVIHRNVIIEAGVTIVGPTVIGAASRVRSRAVVARSVIAPGAVVDEEGRVCDALWFNDDSVSEAMRHEPREDRWSYVQPRVDLASTANPQRRSQARSVPVKRTVDAACALIGLIALFPLMALIALIIWLGEGPVFYGDEREGLGGHAFRCWKFRTMSSDAHVVQRELSAVDQVDGPHFKVKMDPRVTRLGAVLRASNIDELPQLFNVLIGDMSLVGPRPSPFRENQICVPWREARISVRPGITGLWQVCRHDRESGDFHQWIEYDLLYVQHMSLWLDLKILVGTVVTLGGKLGHLRPAQLIRLNEVDPAASRRTYTHLTGSVAQRAGEPLDGTRVLRNVSGRAADVAAGGAVSS
jgi:lipopolysaccharide/colanic/teichoic acid biosynthesis glycosyltransferase